MKLQLYESHFYFSPFNYLILYISIIISIFSLKYYICIKFPFSLLSYIHSSIHSFIIFFFTLSVYLFQSLYPIHFIPLSDEPTETARLAEHFTMMPPALCELLPTVLLYTMKAVKHRWREGKGNQSLTTEVFLFIQKYLLFIYLFFVLCLFLLLLFIYVFFFL